MDKDKIKQIITQHDFKKRSISYLSKKLGISNRTISRYMRELNIKRARGVKINRFRDKYGRFSIKPKLKKISCNNNSLDYYFNKTITGT